MNEWNGRMQTTTQAQAQANAGDVRGEGIAEWWAAVAMYEERTAVSSSLATGTRGLKRMTGDRGRPCDTAKGNTVGSETTVNLVRPSMDR